MGISPNEALKDKNRIKVLQNQARYEKSFRRKSESENSFEIENKVLIRNEIKKNKMDAEFKETGKIIGLERKNVYVVKTDKDVILRRHSSQLRGMLA